MDREFGKMCRSADTKEHRKLSGQTRRCDVKNIRNQRNSMQIKRKASSHDMILGFLRCVALVVLLS